MSAQKRIEHLAAAAFLMRTNNNTGTAWQCGRVVTRLFCDARQGLEADAVRDFPTLVALWVVNMEGEPFILEKNPLVPF